ncbi:unnamed protein product [Protopolystoma xenopodis]|uniref:Uncharacterized protein n=1 Tax=Protopolystoma xenopodis TaxID=117903 RepID=A0A3S5A5Y2_9PLAT|nr:unnamed protein product [Protopolystoma xenopodis]
MVPDSIRYCQLLPNDSGRFWLVRVPTWQPVSPTIPCECIRLPVCLANRRLARLSVVGLCWCGSVCTTLLTPSRTADQQARNGQPPSQQYNTRSPLLRCSREQLAGRPEKVRRALPNRPQFSPQPRKQTTFHVSAKISTLFLTRPRLCRSQSPTLDMMQLPLFSASPNRTSSPADRS